MNFLADVIGAGFKGALIKFFRLLFFAIIILIVVYVVGIFTNKKAKALTLVGTESQPAMVDNERKHGSTYGVDNGTYQTTLWYSTHFQDTWTINNDYDLTAFKIIRFNYVSYDNTYNNSSGEYTDPPSNHTNSVQANIYLNGSNFYFTGNDNYLTVFGYMQTNEGNVACFTTSEIDNYVFCPIHRGLQVYQFWLEIAVNTSYGYKLKIDYEVRSERSYYNYDNTTIVQSQQQTQQTLTDSNTTTSQNNSTTALSTIQSNMNTKLKGTNELTQMVMAPLTSLISISSTTCQPLTWNIPLVNYSATIPCMSTIYNQYFSAVITLFATIITGVYSYRTIVKLVSTIKDALDAESDKLEVLDL